VGLNLLRVEHPQVHLIVDKDGKTNQPVPKHPRRARAVQDTLLDLRANEASGERRRAAERPRDSVRNGGARSECEVHYLRDDRPLWDRDRPERSAHEDGQAA
jgi:translocation and assembly module TamB